MPTARGKSLPWSTAVAVGTLAILVAWWLLPRTPTKLSDQGYDVTLALYRVCNQRSVEGLAQIEQQLATMPTSDATSDASRSFIAAIVDQAKTGQWQAASIACRKMLDDQVVAIPGD